MNIFNVEVNEMSNESRIFKLLHPQRNESFIDKITRYAVDTVLLFVLVAFCIAIAHCVDLLLNAL